MRRLDHFADFFAARLLGRGTDDVFLLPFLRGHELLQALGVVVGERPDGFTPAGASVLHAGPAATATALAKRAMTGGSAWSTRRDNFACAVR